MTSPNLPKRLLPLLMAYFLPGSFAAAQYSTSEAYSLVTFDRVSDIASTAGSIGEYNYDEPAFRDILTRIANGNVWQSKITGTIIPTEDSSFTGGPYGIDSMSSDPVPVTAYVVTDSNKSGGVTGSNGEVGYNGDQILAVYIRIGPETTFDGQGVHPGTLFHEVGYVNFPPLAAKSSPLENSEFYNGSNFSPLIPGTPEGSSSSAELWSESGDPNPLSINFDGRFMFGPIFADFGSPLGDIYIGEGSNYSIGHITSIESRNISLDLKNWNENYNEVSGILARLRGISASLSADTEVQHYNAFLAKKAVEAAKIAEKKAKKKAKKKGGKRLEKKAKKAKKAVKKAVAAAPAASAAAGIAAAASAAADRDIAAAEADLKVVGDPF